MNKYIAKYCLILFIIVFVTKLYAKNIQAVKTDLSPIIDGYINEDCWEYASVIDDFYLLENKNQEKAKQQTIVKIIYNNNFLYFGIRCFENNIQDIKGKQISRDADLSLDDCIIIMLDTYYEKRDACFLGVNVLGTMQDGKIIDDGRSVNNNWDGIWKAKTSIDSIGWFAEIEMPLDNFNIIKDSNVTFGLNVIRYEKPSQEISSWEYINNVFQVSQYGTFSGLYWDPKIFNINIQPYSSFKYNQFYYEDISKKNIHFGSDFTFRFKSNYYLSGTIKPDYAQLEADPFQFNLSYRKADDIWLPEKRPFFIDIMDFYDTPHKVLYTRKINDVDYGIKFGGKNGDLSHMGFVIQEFDSLINYYGLKLKYDILNNKSFNIFGISKTISNDNYNNVYGINVLFPLTKRNKLTAQYTKSIKNDVFVNNNSGFMEYIYKSKKIYSSFKYEDIGSNCFIEPGYISIYDRDRKIYTMRNDYTWWINNNNIKWLLTGYKTILKTDHFDKYVKKYNEIKASMLFEKKYFIGWQIYESNEYYDLWYNNISNIIVVSANYNEWAGYGASAQVGRLFDNKLRLFQASISFNPMKKMNVSVDAGYEIYGDGKYYIFVNKITKRIFDNLKINSYMEYNSTLSNKTANIMIEFQPFKNSVIYLAYTYNEIDKPDNHIAFLKYTWNYAY